MLVAIHGKINIAENKQKATVAVVFIKPSVVDLEY